MLFKCIFVPQVWINDHAVEVAPEGQTTWTVDLTRPPSHPYERDNLRFAASAPSWCKDWSGPFEVECEPVENDR